MFLFYVANINILIDCVSKVILDGHPTIIKLKKISIHLINLVFYDKIAAWKYEKTHETHDLYTPFFYEDFFSL